MYVKPKGDVFNLSVLIIVLQLGRLNLLTPTRVKAASSEVKTGEMVSLKYDQKQSAAGKNVS